MTNILSAPPEKLDDFVRAYENAWQQPGEPELKEFLPTDSSPLFGTVLRELVRVDLEFRWERDRPRPLQEYQRRYPELFRDLEAAGEIAYEEYRLRLQAGDHPAPEEYEKQFGISTAGWHRPLTAFPVPKSEAVGENPDQLPPTRRTLEGDVNHKSLVEMGAATGCVEEGQSAEDQEVDHVTVLRELSAAYPQSARRLAEATTEFPRPGTEACGFRLLLELGRGAFARVYLARQGELADRPVAVKFSPDAFYEESQTLAQLQHTNIVPIYSLHHAKPFVVVCMPYFGATTLADVFKSLRARKEFPSSGKELVTTLQDSFKLSISTVADPGSGEPASGFALSGLRGEVPANPSNALQHWQGLSFSEAVLWIGSRLADGLQHAHERGILHRDLKPANVLLTDEGEPMLLDFNLAENIGRPESAAAARLGGTLPYMAPECLQAMLLRTPSTDSRSDLYALGIILYELLTSRHPFPTRRGPARDTVPLLLQDRRAALISPRRWNRAVSPAVSAIVLKCLQPDPTRRYQSARHLGEDLECQLHHRPLRHAADRSVRERAAKWVRRHPRLASSTTVAGVALALLAGLLGLFFFQGQQQTRLEAQAELRHLSQALQNIPFLLARPDAESAQLEEGITLCRNHANKFNVLAEQDWQRSARFQALDEAQREELRQSMGELLWFWARAEAWKIPDPVESSETHAQIQLALKLNTLAAACYPEAELPAPLLRQRAKLLERVGSVSEATQLLKQAETYPPRNSREHYLELCEKVGQGQWQQALPFLQKATLKGPGNSAVWLVLGVCHGALGEFAEAKACFDHGIALAPDSPWAWFNRGVLNLMQEKNAEAKFDFSQALKLRANMVEALMNRAVAELKLSNAQAAVNDLTEALEQKAPYTRIYFMRARAKIALKDLDGAKKDQDNGLLLQPSDELSWVARGVSQLQLKKDAKGALADFDEALKVNPQSLDAWQNKALILSEYLKRTDEAIQALDKAIAFHPHFALAWAGRGVLLARQGKRTEAHRDAVKALALSQKPDLCYQVAGIYALTSTTHPEDRKEAVRLLQKALSQDKSLLNLIPIDPDLNSIRQHPDFQTLVKLAAQLQ